MTITKKEIGNVIIQHIKETYGEEGTETIEKLKELVGIEDEIEYDMEMSLEELVEEGLKATGMELKAKQIEEEDPRLIQYFELLRSKGYFNGFEEGTEKYQKRYDIAKMKFLENDKKQKKIAEEAKEEGNKLLKEQKYEEAIEAYKKAIKANPNNAIYHSNLAAAYIRMEKEDEALEACLKAIEKDNKYAKAWGRAASIYEKRGETEEAIKHYKKAAALDPASAFYTSRLRVLNPEEQQQAMPQNPFGNLGNLMGQMGGQQGGGMPDLGSMFNNPQFMQMANQMMQSPGFSNMAKSMMSSMGVDTDELQEETLKILEDMDEVKESENLQQFVEEFRENPMITMTKYKEDEEVKAVMKKVMEQQSQNGNNPFEKIQNMFGGGPPPSGGPDSGMFS